MTVTLTEENFEREVSESKRPVLVGFELNRELSVNNYKCCKVAQTAVNLAKKYNITQTPAVVCFKNGKATDTIVGDLKEEQLLKILN